MSTSAAEPAQPGARGFRHWPRAGRWATYIAAGLALLLVVVLAFAVYVVRRSFPQTSGTMTVPGLGQKVTVIRDGHGIPQIYAGNAHDLFFAQGFVQAQDRFFEMDVRRHITAGRLSEMFGRSTLKTDMYIRTMGWRRVAERELTLLKPSTLSYLNAFSAGVNAYLHTRTPTQLSLEYAVLGLKNPNYTVADWTPADSVSWLIAMAWDLRSNMDDEIARATMSLRLSPAQIAQLYPGYPYQQHEPIVTEGGLSHGRWQQNVNPSRRASRPAFAPQAVRTLDRLQRNLDEMPQLIGHGNGIGSNAWAVAGSDSTTGAPLLANDPHLAISVPGIWYQMGLHCTHLSSACPFDVSGFTFSGLPGVVIGHNQQIAWGFTNLGPDVLDLYLEKVEGNDYLYDGRMHPLRSHVETIHVLGSKPVRFDVRSTDHGPLLSDVSAQLSTVGADAPGGPDAPPRDNGYAVAIEWTALIPNNTTDAIFELDRATNWRQFRSAARDFAAPSQNMVYADRAGHIGYQAPGLIPIRRPGDSGDYPARGWLPADDWSGRFVPFDALPTEIDPADGYIVTANQAVTEPSYPYFLGDSWDYGYRSQRIVDLLGRQPKVSPAEMARIQLDTYNGFAPTLVPYLLRIGLPRGYWSAGQRLLQHWDFREPADSAPAAYFNAVWKYLLSLTFDDQLPKSTWPDGDGRWFEVVTGLLKQPNSPWWDNVSTHHVVETRDTILKQAMELARDELVRMQSRRPSGWSWGHQHQMRLENQTVGQSSIGLVRWLFNRGGYPVGGGGDLVDATHWNAAKSTYDVTSAPSMRMVVSLADLDASRWINLTGASGHAFDKHYVDQTKLWVAGRTLPWPFSRAAVSAAAADTLTLLPGGTS
ncbi:MAG: penicillin acylase family protein [Nocardioidaceae bacterium]